MHRHLTHRWDEESDFKNAVAAMLAARTGPALAGLRIAAPETYLLFSGMEALSMGIKIADRLVNTGSVRTLAQQKNFPDYFETLPLIRPDGLHRVRIANLNPGFLSTSGLTAEADENWLRITVGQETREWLVEKLSGFAWLNDAGLKRYTPADLSGAAKRIAADAMQGEPACRSLPRVRGSAKRIRPAAGCAVPSLVRAPEGASHAIAGRMELKNR